MITPMTKDYKGLISITGPTNSGKSKLAEFLIKEQYNLEIENNEEPIEKGSNPCDTDEEDTPQLDDTEHGSVLGNNKSEETSLYSGTTSVSFLSAITTPAAWVATFLFRPSNFKERSVSFFTLGSSFISFCNRGSPAMHWVKFCGLDGSKGIIFDILSTNP